VDAQWAEQVHADRCPDWAKESLPQWVKRHVGKFGLGDPWSGREGPVGSCVAGIDRWQANSFVVYRPQTAAYLYGPYTPLEVDYAPGTLPTYEKAVAECMAGLDTDRHKAVALLTRALPQLCAHPAMPPFGAHCPPDRALDDELLLRSGKGWCNEQARVFVRLCQVAGIPARMVFLFYSDGLRGHVVTEFYAEGRWSMADPTWFCVFPAGDGHLMSAAECHGDGEGKKLAGRAYFARMQELLACSDQVLVGRQFDHLPDEAERKTKTDEAAAKVREDLRAKTAESLADQLGQFGVLNYPLPR
jgi:hypothetical protein